MAKTKKTSTKISALTTSVAFGLTSVIHPSPIQHAKILNEASAQPDDDFDFGMPASGLPSQGPSASSSSADSSDKSKVLTQEKKEKLAKSSIEDITNENFPEMIDSFDFPDVNITDVVKAISELTGKNFIIDQGVRGKITIIAPTRITVAEAYKAFLSALAINGFAVIPSGGFYKIRTARNAQRDSINTYSGSYYPNADQMITRIIHLKHIRAEDITKDLRILTSRDGEINHYNPTNSLIMSDYGSNVDRVMKIISQLDVQGFEDQLEVIPVRYAKAKDIAELIDKIVNKGQNNTNNRSGAGSFSAGVPRFNSGSRNQTGSAYYMVIPDDRTNSLIVTGNKAGLDRIKSLLRQLDFRLRPEDAGGVYVYYVRHGEAEKIAQTLSGIAKDAGPRPGSTGGSSGIGGAGGLGAGLALTNQGVQAQQAIFGGDVKITADKGTNSLVVVASKQDYEVVLNLLNKIDIARDQVYVESIIMEMKNSDANNYQVGVFQFDKSGSGAKVGFNGFSSGSIAELLNPASGSGTILGFGSNEIIEVKAPGAATGTKIPSLIGFINYLKTVGNVNILSTPQIMALDNQEASIEVGDKIVTSVSTTFQNGNPIQSQNQEEATIKLKIKPFISPTTNSIRMEVDSSVKQPSTASTPTALQSTSQPLATRAIKTNIVVRNGDTAVLGGLMKDDTTEETSKVPLLGDIPVIGWLFKSKRSKTEKTNLLVFLTPKIIRSQNDNAKLLGSKLDQRLDFIKSQNGQDPYGKTADELQKKVARVRDANQNTENLVNDQLQNDSDAGQNQNQESGNQ